MAESIKFTNKYVDTTGIYDSVLQITQAELNSKAVTVDLTSASIGTPNPVNADTLGGDPASDFFKSANVVNNFTTTEPGYALDARAGKSLNDSLTNSLNTKVARQTSNAGNVTDINTLNALPCGVYARYISSSAGVAVGWYGILVATTDLNNGVPTQILFGTNRIYVRHSDDRVTWVMKSVSLS